MGHVYLGRSAGGRLVAVKIIRPELAGEPGFRARFAREVVAARNVSGLFTALVIDADVQGPMPWLATAYVPGPSLAEAVEQHGRLPAASVLTLAAGLAEGLQAIHAAGVVHRDLKPSNVLLADDGPRVIDFGISRATEASMLTQSGTVMGSPGFMSPEQAEGRAVGPSSDVFSLGAVLTFAASGEGPFGSGPTPALLYRVVHCDPDSTHLPAEIRPLVERCLAKDPAQRPTTSDLLGELGAAEPVADWLPAPITEVFHQYVPPPPSSPPAAAELAAAAGWADADDATVGFPAIPADVPAAAATVADGGPPTATGFAGVAALAGAAAAEPGGPGEPAGPGQPAGPGKHERPASSGAGKGRPPRSKWGRMAWAALVAVLVAGSATGGVALRNSLGQQQINTASSTPPPAGSPSSSASSPSSGPTSPAAVAAPKNNDPATQAPASSAQAPPTADQAQHSRSATTSPTSPSGGSPAGPATSAVPNVVGSTLSAATSALKARGFSNISSVSGCYGGTAGDVVKQNPAAGVQAALIAAIQLSAQASNCDTVPNVVGMTQVDATSALQAAGFTDIYAEDGCYSGTVGDVVSQTPAAGTSYAGNQQVTIHVQADSCT
jgi:serine/threonine protein kinase